MPSAKPFLTPLKTPKNMVFPSELRSDSGSSLSSDNVKQEDGGVSSSTPITPPAAYTEFLKALTPVFSSPSSAGFNFSKFNMDRDRDRPAHSPTSQPASAVSGSFAFNNRNRDREHITSEPIRSATASLPPPTPFTAPGPGPHRRDPRSLRSLRIPPALRYSPTTMESPRSATTIRSPYSPSDWKLRYYDAPRSASGRVSVRHVVTHTVTYKRTQLDAPPKGKRRKCHENKERES